MSRTTKCLCGVEVTAEDAEALIEAMLEHTRADHPELQLTPVHVRNFLEAEDRTSGAPTERLESIGEIEIVPIRKGQGEEVARFFDFDAFPDNFAWASCYCTSYFEPGESGRPWKANRAATCSRVDGGLLTGSLAYVDGKLVGFCNATARSELRELGEGDDEGVCSVVCFVVAPPYRRHGLARRLLDGAIEEARSNGFTVIEAYPRAVDEGNAAHAYAGTPQLYEQAGFQPVSGTPSVVRLAL